ncbi:MAG: response regulator [Acidobacteriota bacterium]
MIVEDDRPTSALLRAMLEGESCLVEVAYDGEEAMARLGKSRYDLILLDISLPKRLSGADILQHLSLHDPDQLTRVIVVTGMDVSEIRKLFPTICHAFGKPVIPSRVLSYVRSCIGIGGPDAPVR